MKSGEIRRRFVEFFKQRGHAVLPSASLVPAGDPSVLFTTAGMQPLAPYLLGAPHPLGRRLVNIQKCVRTQDIAEVGDATHDTFFEMLGNWSLGDYFKEEAIKWSYELLTSAIEGFGLEPVRLYVTVFAGDEVAPRDEESVRLWQELGIPAQRIYYLGAKDNWWPAFAKATAGKPSRDTNWTWSGPTGPDTEMFYDVTPAGLGDLSHDEFVRASDEQKLVEIWNDVFMAYEARDGKIVGPLKNKNVDTGAGLERLAMVLQKKDNIFATDLFVDLLAVLPAANLRSSRIMADHLRTAAFLIADGVRPSNTERGYVLRRLLRRAIFHHPERSFTVEQVAAAAGAIVNQYAEVYPEVNDAPLIKQIIVDEGQKFTHTLKQGLAEFNRLAVVGSISAHDAFVLFTSYGFPLELTMELASERGVAIEQAGLTEEFARHQALSRVGAGPKFKGGLADDSPATVRLHTAHHLLLAALQKVLGPEVKQRGSNITAERLRLDFTFARKLTAEELLTIEKMVNEHIAADWPVTRRDLPRVEAEKLGAEHEFGAKYGEVVSVYFIGPDDAPVSKEF